MRLRKNFKCWRRLGNFDRKFPVKTIPVVIAGMASAIEFFWSKNISGSNELFFWLWLIFNVPMKSLSSKRQEVFLVIFSSGSVFRLSFPTCAVPFQAFSCSLVARWSTRICRALTVLFAHVRLLILIYGKPARRYLYILISLWLSMVKPTQGALLMMSRFFIFFLLNVMIVHEFQPFLALDTSSI